jgi:MFS family permease
LTRDNFAANFADVESTPRHEMPDADGVTVNESPDLPPVSTAGSAAAAADDIAAATIQSESPTNTTGAPSAEPPRVGAWFTIVYVFTYFGFYLVLFMPAVFSLAYKIDIVNPAGKGASLGLVVGIGSLASLITGPILGVISDNIRLRIGRRRPMIAGGLIVSLLAALIIATASSIPQILIGWIVAAIATGAISAGLNPVLAERVPTYQRGKLGALSGVAASIAGVGAYLLGSLLTGNVLFLFTLPVAVFALGVVLYLIFIPDNPAHADARIGSILNIFKNMWFNPRKHKDFAWVWLGKFFLQFGLAFFTTYELYFLLDRLGFTPAEAARQSALVGGFSLLATILFTVAAGWISDRIKRRKVFIYIAASMMAIGLVGTGLSHDFVTFAICATVLSAGTGAFNSVDLATATDVLPNKLEAGKYMSIYQLSGSIPGAIGPLVAPALLAIGGGTENYTALFVFGGILTAGAAITASRLRGVR